MEAAFLGEVLDTCVVVLKKMPPKGVALMGSVALLEWMHSC